MKKLLKLLSTKIKLVSSLIFLELRKIRWPPFTLKLLFIFLKPPKRCTVINILSLSFSRLILIILAGSEDFIYDGEWQFGHRTGRGHAIWAGRQESYTGEWLKGDFHGRGETDLNTWTFYTLMCTHALSLG